MRFGFTPSTLTKFLVVISFFFIGNLSAQISVSGTLIDETNAEPLMFANVFVEGNEQLGTTTDLDGKFQFTVPEGIYNLVFSYIGYQDKIIEEVVAEAGEPVYLEVALSDGAVDLGVDVTIKAKAVNTTENAVMLLRKKSVVIQDNFSSSEMRKYNIGDAAGAMEKVTGTTITDGKYVYIRGLGDRYSISQLNGMVIPSSDPYRNGAQLDLIPTSILDNIVTSKTYTPDQPGYFTGGNVDIRTKSFPETFTLNVSVSAGYNSQNNRQENFLTYPGGSNDYWGYGSDSRARPDILSDPEVKELGILNQSLPNNPRNGREGATNIANLIDQSVRSVSNDFTPDSIASSFDHGFGFAFGNQIQLAGNPLGIIATGSFKQSYSHLNAFDKANWTLRDVNSDDLFNQGDFKETVSTQTPSVNGMIGFSYKVGQNNTFSYNAIYSHQADKKARFIEGERPDNIIDPLKLFGRSLVFIERELINHQFGAEHVIPSLNNIRIEYKGSLANLTQLEPDTRFFEFQYDTKSDFANIPASNVQIPFHFWRDLEDKQKEFKLDITIPFTNNSANKIKFGGLYSNKNRNFHEYRYQIQRDIWFFQGEVRASEAFNGDIDSYLSDDNIGILDVYDDTGTEEPRYVIGNRLIDVTVPRNSYEGSEEITAFYGMVTYALSEKLKFVGGARYEKTDILVESLDTLLPDSVRFGVIDVSDILPSANLIFALNEDMNLRATYTKTLARPNLREIAPFSAYDPLEKTTWYGNPKLTKTNISNFDLRWEWFPTAGEVVAISGFYKDFTDPIVLSYRRAPSPELEYNNVPSAQVMGIELEVRKNLGFIAPALSHFKFSTNVSFINSSADVFETEIASFVPEERPFEGQAPFILNTALIYSDFERGVDAVLSLNSIGDRMKIIGREGTPDIYERGRNQLDFSFSKKINDVTLKLSARNILNTDFVLSSDYKGQEFLYYRYKTGITYGIGLSYNIK